jgi:uncharacterized protein (TIGR02001 family)
MTITRYLTLAAFAAILAAPAAAQEARAVEETITTAINPDEPIATPGFAVYTGGAVELSFDEYGADSGSSLSGEAYIEGEYNGFYAGLWAMATDQTYDNEVDLYLGYRNELDSGFSYDVGYTRYYYPEDGGDCCGEITLGLYTPIGDSFGAGVDFAYDPENEVGNAYIYGEYYATEKWTISANYGSYEVVEAESETEWDFGATYAINDEVGVDMRWYDGSEYDGYFGLMLSFDTTILSP